MPSVRELFYGLMTDRINGAIPSFFKWMLWICSLIYGFFVKLIVSGYERKAFTPYRADSKVISIGNITLGGTGKTQASIAIARMLEARGKRVSILIRGYGVDECMMLQEELKDVPVLVGPDRIQNAKRAFYDFGIDTVVLDDGFQHWRIDRDLDIVLLDATNPFGNYFCLPRGILREPITTLKRADLIVITKVNSRSAKLKEIYKILGGLKKKNCVMESIYKPLELHDISKGAVVGLKAVDGKKVCLVSSIGNPGYFKQNCIQLGAQIELEFTYLDHYNYKKEDFDKIDYECKYLRLEYIIVTKKDAVKIKRLTTTSDMKTPILVLDVDFEITKNRKLLDDRLSRVYSN